MRDPKAMPPVNTSWVAANPYRIIYYVQTFEKNGQYFSILPIQQNPTGVTHIYLAAIHINDPPGSINLNDHPFGDPYYDPLWPEVSTLQQSGIRVLGMLGGAAKGSFARLDIGNEQYTSQFEAYYTPLRGLLRQYKLQGLDLDVEESMSQQGITNLVDRLKADFPTDFDITLSPVAAALMPGGGNLSGFSYFMLESAAGDKINWYNAQFYNGWGDISSTANYDALIAAGWSAAKVNVGALTNPANGGSGFVSPDDLSNVLSQLADKYGSFGGTSGWEYFNSLPDENNPWMWAAQMNMGLGMKQMRDMAIVMQVGRSLWDVRRRT